MPATTPIYLLRYQELGDPPHGPDLGKNLALDVEAQLDRIDTNAARIAQDGTTLTDDAATVVNTFQDWGTQTIVFPSPPSLISVTAQLTGRAFRVAAPANGTFTFRIGISLNGGTSFFFPGNVPPNLNVGNDAGSPARVPIAASAFLAGTPTGDVIVKAQLQVSADLGISFADGFLTAVMLPS